MSMSQREWEFSPCLLVGKKIESLEIFPHSLILSFSSSHYLQFCAEHAYFNPMFDKFTIETEGFTNRFLEVPVLKFQRQYLSIINDPPGSTGSTSRSVYVLETRAGSAKFTFNLRSPDKVLWVSLIEILEGGPIC